MSPSHKKKESSEKNQELLSTPAKNYWKVRNDIRDAAIRQDNNELRLLAAQYPEIFANMCNQAANALRYRH